MPNNYRKKMQNTDNIYIHLWLLDDDIFIHEQYIEYDLEGAINSFLDLLDRNIGDYSHTIYHEDDSMHTINIADEAVRYMATQGYIKGDFLYDRACEYANKNLVKCLESEEIKIKFIHV